MISTAVSLRTIQPHHVRFSDFIVEFPQQGHCNTTVDKEEDSCVWRHLLQRTWPNGAQGSQWYANKEATKSLGCSRVDIQTQVFVSEKLVQHPLQLIINYAREVIHSNLKKGFAAGVCK